MRTIDADALKEVILSKSDSMEDLWDTAGVLNAIDNAPTVEQPNCSHCDYWNFTQKIIEIIVEVMTKYGIERVEDLHRELDRLKGGEEE